MNPQTTADVEEKLSSNRMSARDLYALWERRRPVSLAPDRQARTPDPSDGCQIAWLQESVALARRFTERSLEQGECLLACDAAREAQRYWADKIEPRSKEFVRLCLAHATALMRLGFTQQAQRELQAYAAADSSQPLEPALQADVWLRLGEIRREESQHAESHAARLVAANEALGYYERALAIEPNRPATLGLTAVMALLLSEPHNELRARAELLAQRTLDAVERYEGGRSEDQRPADGATWRNRWSQALARTVLGDEAGATAAYREMEAEGASTLELSDARYRAQASAIAAGLPRTHFNAAFPPLQLVVFAGDRPSCPAAELPIKVESIEPVRRAIRAKLDELDVRVGMVCPAAGADLLFIEALLDRGGVVHLVMPWSQSEFLQSSVRRFEPDGLPAVWEPLFRRAIAGAATIRELGQAYEPTSDVGWEYLLEVTAGIALQAARASHLDVQPVTIQSDADPVRAAANDSFISFWRRELLEEPLAIEVPTRWRLDVGDDRLGATRLRCERSTMHQEVKTMLFADIVGYSKLPEKAIPLFVEAFLGKVSQLIAASRYAPRTVATWGDAVHATFDFAYQAGGFALEIIRLIEDGNGEWLQKGLYWQDAATEGRDARKNALNIRIGLHTGPVFVHYNPVIRQIGFTGAHVSRAARIEPVAGAGEVFASEEFAALAELGDEIRRRRNELGREGTSAGFVCEYAGSLQLAKGYPGRHRIYRLLPRRELVIELLAKAAHELYCIEAEKRGETSKTNSALRPWEGLPGDLQDANRAQVLDIPHKLRILGYELASYGGLGPREIEISVERLEELAILEHDRWMNDRRDQGWTYAAVRDNFRKHHPLLLPWDRLSAVDKEKDRDVVRSLPRLIERAELKVRKIRETKA
jgi:class 3 adenylate cyclase